MSTGVDHVLPATRTAPRRGRLGHGRTWILASGDLLALTVAYVLTYVAADMLGPLPPVSAPSWFLTLLVLSAVPIWLAIFTGYGLYEADALQISVSSFDEVRSIFHAMLAGSLAYLILSQGVRFLFDWWVYTAVEAALFISASLVLVPVLRGSIRSWVFPRVMERRRTLIVGGGEEALLVHRKLGAHPEYGLEVVGFLAAEEDDVPGPVLGASGDVARLVDELEIDRVIIATSIDGHEQMLDLLRSVRRHDVQISIVPRYFEIFTSQATFDDIEGMPVVTLPPLRLGRSSRVLKRSFDVCAAGAALIVLAPLLAAVAVVIKLDSPGPALYRQKRRGRNGSTFEIVKFRSMYTGAEAKRAEVLHLNEVDGPLFKIKGDDPRVTKRRRVPPQDEHRRVPAVLERAPRRHEPRRAAAVRRVRGRPDHRLGEPPARHDPRDHGPLAGARPQRHAVRRDDEARLRLRHELVALVGPEDPVPDDPGRARQARRLLSRQRSSRTSPCTGRRLRRRARRGFP